MTEPIKPDARVVTGPPGDQLGGTVLAVVRYEHPHEAPRDLVYVRWDTPRTDPLA